MLPVKKGYNDIMPFEGAELIKALAEIAKTEDGLKE